MSNFAIYRMCIRNGKTREIRVLPWRTWRTFPCAAGEIREVKHIEEISLAERCGWTITREKKRKNN